MVARRDEASVLPDACSVIDQGTIARLVRKPNYRRDGRPSPKQVVRWGMTHPHPRWRPS